VLLKGIKKSRYHAASASKFSTLSFSHILKHHYRKEDATGKTDEQEPKYTAFIKSVFALEQNVGEVG
jgi:hypothetical protein